jgi:hypothetical protein
MSAILSARRAEVFAKKFFAQLYTLVGERNRFRFPYRIQNHSFRVQTSESVPVVTFPRASFVMERQKEEREHHLIYFVLVIVHERILALRTDVFNRLRGARTPNQTPDRTAYPPRSSGAGRVTGRAASDHAGLHFSGGRSACRSTK